MRHTTAELLSTSINEYIDARHVVSLRLD